MAAESGSRTELDRTMLARWGRFIQHHRGWVLASSIVVALGVLALFPAAGPFQVGGEPSTITESGKAYAAILDNLPEGAKPSFILILSEPTRAWDDAAFRSDVTAALDPITKDPRVESVVSPYTLPPGQGLGLVSKDGHRVLAIVTLNMDMLSAKKVYDEVRGLAKDTSTLTVIGTGGLALGSDFNKVFETDMPRTESISMPLTMLVLVIVFGAVVAAILPLGIGFLAVGGGIALTGVLANVVELPDWSTQLVSLIALGVAIDYCLFVVNRFREELDGAADPKDKATRATALGRTMATSGHAVLFSGLTVAFSLGGLAFFNGLQFAGNGYAVAAAVGFAVLMAMTLLPAILAFLGPRINKLHLGRSKAKRQARAAAKAERRNLGSGGDGYVAKPREEGGFWHNLAGGVMRFPVAFTVLVLLVVGILASPLAGIRFGGFSPEQLPTEFESRQGFDLLASDFAKQGASEIDVVMDFHNGLPRTESHLGALWDLGAKVQAMDHVNSVESLATVIPGQTRDAFIQAYSAKDSKAPVPPGLLGGSIAVLKVHVDVVADAPEAGDLVEAIRALSHPDGTTLLVGGFTAQRVDTVHLIADRLPYAATFIILATIVILTLQVRSLVLPVKAVLMNLLSVAASFGLAVWIFQDGHLADLLHFTPTPLEPGNLVLMFCIVFGLSMDYEVLLLSRMHEAYLQTGDNRRAVQRGLESSGRIITGAALIMVFVFGAFGIIRITFMKVIGVGLAFAVLFDATIIRALLVPALMRLMGSANWWAPRWMRAKKPNPVAATPDADGGDDPLQGQAEFPRVTGTTQSTVQPGAAIPALRKVPTRATPQFTVTPWFSDPAVQKWYEAEEARKRARAAES